MLAKNKAAANTLGRSFLKGEVTLDEIRELTSGFDDSESLFDDEMMDGSDYDVRVVDGDLHFEGDLRTFEHDLCGLVVTGNLTVDGLFADTDDPATGVFVLGDMTAARVVTKGTLGVKGSLTATEVLVGFYNDYGADIGKDVVTPLFTPENHHFEIGGKLKAKAVVGHGAEFRIPNALKADAEKLKPKNLYELLVPEVIEGDPEHPHKGEVDDSELRKRVLAGQPIFAR